MMYVECYMLNDDDQGKRDTTYILLHITKGYFKKGVEASL